MSKRVIALLGVAGVLVASALIAGGTLAFAGSSGTRLDAKVLATNPGPLTTCCSELATTVHYFIRIENGNGLTETPAFATRARVHNAFVVNSIDRAIFIDGVQDHDFDFIWTPPPWPSYQPYSGHWPVSATCPPEGPPCTDISDGPAVLPGEETSIFYEGWALSDGEPNGTYVFKYKIHGTLNGSPVNLTASAPPIVMTS
jgi:hypothetical protein